ncbi:hypothetical protein LL037_18950 [Clostridium estertheticum]|uniref:hypothetical protein n=1 Tax=Clostridium estertheticum TaxID=238834 RepID=UPI001C0AFC76|nr:hypothetical protein [Clostridium estertheticum]MBU3198544.1 hypothetical protein [Clostridium estertheticum]WAG64524.1 hypothetical protein LL037_18950 [Clostridium estertheticum]
MIEDNLYYSKKLTTNYPMISSYPFHANLLSIISNTDEYLSWFYNYYIQLEIPPIGHWLGTRLDFYTPLLWKSCPWIYYQRISRDLLAKKWKSICEFIIDSIDLGYYAYFNIDRFYISEYDSSHKEHRVHDIFVFGYNLKNKTFNIADNFRDNKYYYANASFDEIMESYLNVDDNWLFGVELIKFRKKGEYKFDISIVKDFLVDFLESKNTKERYRLPSEQVAISEGMKNAYINNSNLHAGGWKFGRDIYNVLREYIGLIDNKNNDVDLRSFHVLKEHKVVMLGRLKYLYDNQYISNIERIYSNYEDVKEWTIILLNLMIKYSICGNENILERATKLLYDIEMVEYNVLSEVLNQIIKG